MNIKRLDKKDFEVNETGINQNHLRLSFLDFDFDPELITKKLELEPLSTGQKGDEYFIGSQKQISKTRDCNHWEFEWKNTSNDFIGDYISEFFKEIIIPRLDLIKGIASNCRIVRFNIVQYYYSGHNPGYTFEKEQIRTLSDINAEIDIDTYCLCKDE